MGSPLGDGPGSPLHERCVHNTLERNRTLHKAVCRPPLHLPFDVGYEQAATRELVRILALESLEPRHGDETRGARLPFPRRAIQLLETELDGTEDGHELVRLDLGSDVFERGHLAAVPV